MVRIWLGFSVGIESDLFFVRGIEIDNVRAELTFFKCNDRLTCFCVGGGGGGGGGRN